MLANAIRSVPPVGSFKSRLCAAVFNNFCVTAAATEQQKYISISLCGFINFSFSAHVEGTKEGQGCLVTYW